MAGKQQEQSSVKSGDVLLLYEDSHKGYVFSEITPVLEEYASVCFYQVSPPFSKKDPGLPDINCATFTLQLVNEKKGSSGVPIQYGQSIKLKHTATGKHLGVNRIKVARSEPNLRVELLQDTGEENCQFKILPIHGDYGLGSEVFFDQPVTFENVGVPGHYLNCSSEPYGANLWVLADKYELNASTFAIPLSLILHREVAHTDTYSCRVGKLLQISETRESMSIIAKASRFRQPLAYGSTSVDLKPPAIIEDVCAQDKYTDAGQPWYPTSLWQFEEAARPTSGDLMRFITSYRIKHILTRKYIAVVKCEHEDECPEEGRCNNGYKVILKDRTGIESFDEESGNDETVFIPISPNQQTSTHTVPEGGQLLLKHKQTGLWLNVYHDVTFQWNEVVNRPKSPFGPDLYQVMPFYEVDTTKTVLSVAKEPRHAFTVHHSSTHSEALYDVAGVIPVLTSYFQQETPKGVEDSLTSSEEFEVSSLKTLASDPQYKAFVSHYGVIELLLAMKEDDRQLFAVEVLKLHTSGRATTVYEKNRFIHMTGTISTKILRSVVGIEAIASLMRNNACRWAMDIESQIKDFLRPISSETALILDILGSVCLIGRKAVTGIQDTIVKELIQGRSKNVLYQFVTHGTKVAVRKPGDTEKSLSDLDDKEMHLLELQLILFAKLCQGRNSHAVKAIDKSHAGDDGFISFEEALICTQNESGTIPPSIQAAALYLTRIMYDAEPGESSTEIKVTEKSSPLADHALQLRYWVQKFFASESMKGKPKLFLRAILLLGVQMRKGQFTISDSEEVTILFKEVIGFLLGNYGRVIFSNELMLLLVPLFFNLQLQSEIQDMTSLTKTVMVPPEVNIHDTTSVLRLQDVVLEAIQNHHGSTIPCHLLICYFNWMNLFGSLEEDSQTAILLPQLTDNVESKQELEHAKKEYPNLKNFLNVLVSNEQSTEAESLLKDFAGRCIYKGVPHLRNQAIYSSTALDDILGYIFDPNTSIPLWYWCKLSQSKMIRDIFTSSMSIECFHFLQALAYQNFKVQKRLVSHLDSILSFVGILPVPASKLLVEIFAGEPVTDPRAVVEQVESIHLQISEDQIKQFLKVSNRKGPEKDFPGLPLLHALHFIAKYDEMDLPVTRNQDYIMKTLKLRRPLMRQGKKLLEEPVLPSMTAELPKLQYVLGVTTLLASCAEGKSLSIDAKCKSIYKPRELFGILSNPKICPARKVPFMRILMSVYMDTESTEINVGNRPRMWDCLEIVATFLSEIQLALKDELSQSSVQEVQEILMNALRPFGIPTSTLDTVEVKVLQNDMRDLGGSLLYLVKGVLPMLREFYGSVFRVAHSKPGLKKRQTKISTQICRSLWGLSGELEKVLISQYQVTMLHTATASVMTGLLKAGISPDVDPQQLLIKFSSTEPQKAVAKAEYDDRFPDEEDTMLRRRIKQDLHYNEEQGYRNLLALFQGDKSKSCADALGGVLTWIMQEAPLEHWHIRSSLPGLTTRCLKALQVQVSDLNNDQDEESFGEFCEQFSKGYITEVLKLASATNIEDVNREALILLQNLLDSHQNPFQRKLADSVNDSEKRNLLSHLSDFLYAIHRFLWDSMTCTNARIALQSEIEEKVKEEDEVVNCLKKQCNIPHSAHEGSEDSTVSLSDVTIVMEKGSEAIPLVDVPTRFSQASLEVHMPERKSSSLTKGGLQKLTTGSLNLQLILRIIGLMCDEQNRILQDYLRKQPGKFNSVNLVVDVAELLHHVHRISTLPQAHSDEGLSNEQIEIMELILQALIELCGGNSENQEVVMNRQISHDLAWILTLPGAARSEKLQELKATTVELLEILMEEVAEESKVMVEKLRDDDNLRAALVVAANEFYPSVHEKRTGLRGLLLRVFTSSVVHEHVHTEEDVQHEKRMKDSLFRAYHAAISLQKEDSKVEVTPETKRAINFCRKRSKNIEVIYKNNEGETIHTSVAFPYHPDEELREDVKDIVKWNVDRSSPEDKLLDILEWMKSAKKDIRHQRKLRSGLKQTVLLSSGLRHYLLLLLTFVLNLLVLFNFMVPDNQIPPAVDEIPQANTSIAIDPKTTPEVDTALYTLGAFHFLLSMWMVIEHYAVNWPHYVVHGWKAVVPRFISNYVFTIWKKTNHRWQESPLSAYLMPPEEEHLEASLYGWNSVFRLVFLISSLLSLIPTLQGYFYCICLLYIIEESDILNRVLQAVTKNGTSLLWVGALGVVVLYIYAVVSFAFLHESFFVTSAEVPLFCESLSQCFVSVIRYGLLDNLGLAVPLVSGAFRELGWRMIYDISFFIIVTTIGLNIIFGIIVDTFSELRDARWNSQQDMKDRCFICSIPNYEFDRCTKLENGFQSHIADQHNMWNYIYYSIYVEDTPVRDRTAIQTYIYEMMEKSSIDFFPREAALVLSDRLTEVTTEDLSKQVDTLSEGLNQEVQNELDEGSKKLRAEMYQCTKGIQTELTEQVQNVKEDVNGLKQKVDAVEQSVQRTLEASQQQAADLRQALLEEIAAMSVNVRAVLDRLPPVEGRPQRE